MNNKILDDLYFSQFYANDSSGNVAIFATRELRDSWVNNDNNSGRVALTLLDVVCRFGRALLTAQMIQDTTDKQISWLFI